MPATLAPAGTVSAHPGTTPAVSSSRCPTTAGRAPQRAIQLLVRASQQAVQARGERLATRERSSPASHVEARISSRGFSNDKSASVCETKSACAVVQNALEVKMGAPTMYSGTKRVRCVEREHVPEQRPDVAQVRAQAQFRLCLPARFRRHTHSLCHCGSHTLRCHSAGGRQRRGDHRLSGMARGTRTPWPVITVSICASSVSSSNTAASCVKFWIVGMRTTPGIGERGILG